MGCRICNPLKWMHQMVWLLKLMSLARPSQLTILRISYMTAPTLLVPVFGQSQEHLITCLEKLWWGSWCSLAEVNKLSSHVAAQDSLCDTVIVSHAMAYYQSNFGSKHTEHGLPPMEQCVWPESGMTWSLLIEKQPLPYQQPKTPEARGPCNHLCLDHHLEILG